MVDLPWDAVRAIAEMGRTDVDGEPQLRNGIVVCRKKDMKMVASIATALADIDEAGQNDGAEAAKDVLTNWVGEHRKSREFLYKEVDFDRHAGVDLKPVTVGEYREEQAKMEKLEEKEAKKRAADKKAKKAGKENAKDADDVRDGASLLAGGAAVEEATGGVLKRSRLQRHETPEDLLREERNRLEKYAADMKVQREMDQVKHEQELEAAKAAADEREREMLQKSAAQTTVYRNQALKLQQAWDARKEADEAARQMAANAGYGHWGGAPSSGGGWNTAG